MHQRVALLFEAFERFRRANFDYFFVRGSDYLSNKITAFNHRDGYLRESDLIMGNNQRSIDRGVSRSNGWKTDWELLA
jgi:hypothetical protein